MLAKLYTCAEFVCRRRDLRDVLTVSTQPVDKTVSELIVQLSPSDGIQVLSFTRWNSTNLGYGSISICAISGLSL